ncbi:MAG TPA: DUF5117 domain-containing protein, partial [Puia sp.]|nr:DUF5117 domain-containing protein [Puia sp.]
MKKFLFFLLLFGLSAVVKAQDDFPEKESTAAKLDSLLKLLDAQEVVKIRPYDSVITRDAVAFRGLFTVYKVDDHYYLEIPDSIFSLPILVMSQGEKLPGDGELPGSMLNAKTFYFGAGKDSTILLYQVVEGEFVGARPVAQEGSRIGKAVADAESTPVVLKFPIVALGKGGHSFVVNGDRLLSRASDVMGEAGGQNFHMDKIAAYPENMNFTFSKILAGKFYTYSYTYVALPRVPMPARIRERRVGFFPGGNKVYFSDDQQRVKDYSLIAR